MERSFRFPGQDEERGYKSWQQVAGYFDGDGSPKVHVGAYTINITASWSYKDSEILEHVKKFLSSKGILGRLGRFQRGAEVYFELTVSEGGNALLAFKKMLPFLDKKRDQVRAVVCYLENRSTGNQLVAVLNDAVMRNKRSSSVRFVDMPFTKIQGKAKRNTSGERILTREQLVAMKRERELRGLSNRKIAKVLHVSPGTIDRAFNLYLAELCDI